MEKSSRNGTVKRFFRENMALLIIIACIIAISTIVLVTGLNPPPDNSTVVTPPDDDDVEVVVPPVTYAMPVSGYTLGMQYSATDFVKNVTLKEWQIHKGCDFIVASGAQIKSIADGKVTNIVTNTRMGTSIEVTHANGYKSVYSSLDKKVNVVKDQAVTKGQVLGTASDSAYDEFKDGAHLHLEIYKDNKLVDPKTILTY